MSDSNAPGEVRTRELVAELLARGLPSMEVARLLGVSKSTVCYHKRRLGLDIDPGSTAARLVISGGRCRQH